MQSPPGAETVIDGRRYTYFIGTGYLGLQGRPEVIEAACAAARAYGIGSATSRRGWGNNPATIEAERRAAGFLGCEDAFYFGSGYQGNAVIVDALRCGKGDGGRIAFVDERAHYCVFEAAGMLCGGGSGASERPRLVTFAHLDAADLRGKIEAELRDGERAVVMSDGVFAMSGGVAPVDDYIEVLESFGGGALCLDDAHALGVLGERGRGTFEHAGIEAGRVNAVVDGGDGVALYACGTLSKAAGAYGGIVAGSRAFIEHVKASSHVYNGASAPPTPAAGAAAEALRIMSDEPGLRDRLRANVRAVREGLRGLGLEVADWPTPIVGLTVGDAANMQRIQRGLMEAGVLIAYVASYAGVSGEGALRIAVFATHTDEMIGRLIEGMGRLV